MREFPIDCLLPFLRELDGLIKCALFKVTLTSRLASSLLPTSSRAVFNHKRRKQRYKPIRIQSKPVQSAGKCVLERHDWLSFASHWLRKWREFC